VSLAHPQGWQVCQALIDAGVVPDFRAPDRLRLGFAPLYTRFEDVYRGLVAIRDIVAAGKHLTYPTAPARVT
jgi:kynureninase